MRKVSFVGWRWLTTFRKVRGTIYEVREIPSTFVSQGSDPVLRTSYPDSYRDVLRMVVATNIKTDLWNRVIELLINGGWTVTYKYDGFDAGIDSDFVILEKGNEEILFGWDNWFEGEIKCTADRMKVIEAMVNTQFDKGDPVNLKPDVIELHRKWKAESNGD